MSTPEKDEYTPIALTQIPAQQELDNDESAHDAPHPSEIALRINLLGKLIVPPSAP